MNQMAFTISKGEILSLFGPSGTGKSTLLKIIAGQSKADAGEIELQGHAELVVGLEEVNWDHTVDQILGEKITEWTEEEQIQRKREMIDLFSLFYKDQKPFKHLSLGEQKRVLIARSLASRPSLLLLDEPFSSLDLILKNEIKEELLSIIEQQEMGCLFVTHDYRDVLSFSSRVAILDHGEIRQLEKPGFVYQYPRDAHVARLLGKPFLYPVEILDQTDKGVLVKTEWGEALVKNKHPLITEESKKANLLVWNHEFYEAKNSDALVLKGKVESLLNCGSHQETILSVKNRKLVVSFSQSKAIKKGQNLSLAFNLEEVRLIPL